MLQGVICHNFNFVSLRNIFKECGMMMYIMLVVLLGLYSSIDDTIRLKNCSGCRITFFFSTVVTIDTIILDGMYGATLDSFPPHRVKVLDEGVDKITYDSSTFINDCSYTPDSLYCLVIGTDISDVSSVTIEFESYQESSILLNEIEFYSNGFPLNFQTEQIDNEGNLLTTPPLQEESTLHG